MTSFNLHSQLSNSYDADVARSVRHRVDAPLPPLQPARAGIATTGRRLLAAAKLRPARRGARLA